MHLISLHRLRGLAASQSFLRTASLARKEGSQLRLRDDPEPRLCLGTWGPRALGPCHPDPSSAAVRREPSDIDGHFWLTSREPQLPASDLPDTRRRRTPKHDAIWNPRTVTGDSPVSRESSSDLAHDTRDGRSLVSPGSCRSRHRRCGRSLSLEGSSAPPLVPSSSCPLFRPRQPPLLESANPVPFPCKVYGPALSGAALLLSSTVNHGTTTTDGLVGMHVCWHVPPKRLRAWRAPFRYQAIHHTLD
ncbi:hypothetical protein B0T18DRAFT_414549 [Schizothecium vesticola]|uniref:Uncharacterized protein n=1 Tax=Schizothecium vesticola TaxID=314040 RepID=A0AA40K268_9PEZI|nr:hypothetical protein B0T18DRAFT_414549 [Schizothecium vesticola]